MQKTISFGKVAISGKRKVNEITLDIRFKDGDKPTFSVCGNVWNGRKTDIIAGGQCLDYIKEYLFDNSLFMSLYGLWKRNHLNDIDACANDVQRELVSEYVLLNGSYDYNGVCSYLKEKNAYVVDVNGKKCEYGMEWYYREISENDLAEIRKIMAE